ncbi:Mitochondrial amidoxime reducing component 2 [Chamberlinius hualienensis]
MRDLSKSLLGVGLTAAAGVIFIFFWKKKKLAKKYTKVGEVSHMYIYPIKSCRGIQFNSAKCTIMGLQSGPLKDRVFLLINEEGVFVTARQENKMLLITPSLKGQDTLLVDAPEMPTLAINLDKFKDKKLFDTKDLRQCKVWGQPVDGWDCGDEVAEWFQKFLGKPNYRLVHHNERVRPKYAKEREKYQALMKAGDAAAYADLTPYMLMTESSVEDVNSRIDITVGMRNFRPNIVLRNTEPYAEDHWYNIKMGKAAEFRHVKPCQRCLLTTIDSETAIKVGEDPLKTLRTYRKTKDPFFKQYIGESALLGIGLCVDHEGEIQSGDEVYAINRY